MRAKTGRLAIMGAILAAAFSAPAQASMNDQFVCNTNDERRVHVTILSSDPGKAILYDRKAGASEPELTTLQSEKPARAFRFDAGDTRFMGHGTIGFLYREGEQLLCTFPGSEEAQATNKADPMLPMVMVDSEGLFVRRFDLGADERLPFGTAKDDIVSYLSRYLGSPAPLERNEECGAGALEFRRFGPLTLAFKSEAFAGWSMRGDVGEPRSVAVSLPDGTRAGDPPEALEGGFKRFAGSTLGEEYVGGGVTAVLDEPGERIDVLMGGVNCVFR